MHAWAEAFKEVSKKKRVLSQFQPIVPVIKGLEKEPMHTGRVVGEVDIPSSPGVDEYFLGAYFT